MPVKQDWYNFSRFVNFFCCWLVNWGWLNGKLTQLKGNLNHFRVLRLYQQPLKLSLLENTKWLNAYLQNPQIEIQSLVTSVTCNLLYCCLFWFCWQWTPTTTSMDQLTSMVAWTFLVSVKAFGPKIKKKHSNFIFGRMTIIE